MNHTISYVMTSVTKELAAIVMTGMIIIINPHKSKIAVKVVFVTVVVFPFYWKVHFSAADDA